MTACVGAASAYVLRQTAAATGRFMVDTLDSLIHDLHLERNGTTLGAACAWLKAHAAELHAFGLRDAEVLKMRTPQLMGWIAGGRGRRGAVVGTDMGPLYPSAAHAGVHAVALVYSTDERTGNRSVIMVDPWPGHTEETAPPGTLDLARVASAHHALLIEWRSG